MLAASFHNTRKKKRAALLTLSGNLGSGKTTFVKCFAKALGVRAKVHSPTFVFVREYNLHKPSSRFSKIIHVDAYRMKSRRDVLQTGVREYLKDPRNIVLVEWGERISKWIPKPDLTIKFSHHTPKLRKIKVISNFKNQNGR